MTYVICTICRLGAAENGTICADCADAAKAQKPRSKMTRRALLFVTCLFAAVLLVTPAQASPTGVSWTYAPTPAIAGQPVTLTGTALCDTPTCRYQWRIYGSGYSRLGTPLGEGPSIVTSFRTGTWLVSLKVTNSNGTNGYGQYDQYIRVA